MGPDRRESSRPQQAIVVVVDNNRTAPLAGGSPYTRRSHPVNPVILSSQLNALSCYSSVRMTE